VLIRAVKSSDLAGGSWFSDFSPGEKTPGNSSLFSRLSRGSPWFLGFGHVEY
jgi:hypothetical protein